MSGRNIHCGVNRPTVSSAMKASIVDEEKRKAKVNKTDKLGMGKSVAGYKSGMDKSVAAYSSARGQERVSITTISDNRVVSKPPISASVPKSITSMTKTSVGYSSSVFEKKFARSLSIDDGNSSSFQIARTTAGIDETFSPSNGKLTRLTTSVSNEESSSLQKTLDVSASVRVKLPQDTSQTQYDTRSSYAKTFSTRQTSASRNAELRDNLDFYLGKIRSKPASTGQYVDEMLKWKGDYEILERNHSYIQWLFPIPEGSGFNLYAQPLTEYEAEAIRNDDKASKRVLSAYKMMLDFYGMKLAEENVGTVERSMKNCKDRYEHLNRSRHNLLRITRIIKSLGELGFERFQARWVDFLFKESVVNKVLYFSHSCFNHWIDAITDDAEREIMYRKIHGLTLKEDEPLHNANSESEGEEEMGLVEASDKGCEGGATGGRTRTTRERMGPRDNSPEEGATGERVHTTREEMGPRDNGPEKGATGGMIYTTREVPSKSEGKNIIPCDTAYDPLNEIDRKVVKGGMSYGSTSKDVPSKGQEKDIMSHNNAYDPHNEIVSKISSVHKDLSDREFQTEGEDVGEDVDKLHNDNGYEDDTEDDNTHEALQRFEGIQMDDRLPCDNWKFYKNQIHSRPSPGYTIETILQHAGDYLFLDFYPYFIQWLFPTPTKSRANEEVQPLYHHEADAIRNDDLAFKRVGRAYVLILDYYGMKLVDGASGELKIKSSTKLKSRWKDLNASDNHEFMRVTRVLKSLGELGYERYQVPLIQMFIIKGLQTDKYIKGLTWEHVSHWINCIKDEGEKQAMFEQYKHMMFRSSRSDGQVRRDDHVQHQHTDVNPPYWTDTSQYML